MSLLLIAIPLFGLEVVYPPGFSSLVSGAVKSLFRYVLYIMYAHIHICIYKPGGRPSCKDNHMQLTGPPPGLSGAALRNGGRNQGGHVKSHPKTT